MCGIFGVVSPARGVDIGLLKRASESLEHRGPDGFGYLLCNPQMTSVVYNSSDLPEGRCDVALTNRRLAIIDLPGGNQPMANEDESVWCTFNGEIYNFLELRAELEAEGVQFKSHTDTEVILYLI